MEDTRSNEFNRLEHLAIEALSAYLESDGADPSARDKARVAQGTLGTISRNRQTEGARDALAFQMARSLTSDPGELANYIRVTQPRSAILLALPTKVQG